jgi:hypothetical protein
MRSTVRGERGTHMGFIEGLGSTANGPLNKTRNDSQRGNQSESERGSVKRGMGKSERNKGGGKEITLSLGR